jgi:hypothetical protein
VNLKSYSGGSASVPKALRKKAILVKDENRENHFVSVTKSEIPSSAGASTYADRRWRKSTDSGIVPGKPSVYQAKNRPDALCETD